MSLSQFVVKRSWQCPVPAILLLATNYSTRTCKGRVEFPSMANRHILYLSLSLSLMSSLLHAGTWTRISSNQSILTSTSTPIGLVQAHSLTPGLLNDSQGSWDRGQQKNGRQQKTEFRPTNYEPADPARGEASAKHRPATSLHFNPSALTQAIFIFHRQTRWTTTSAPEPSHSGPLHPTR